MQKNPDGSLLRPTTANTVNQWLSTNPQPGSILVISNQPYVGYQDATARTFLPKEFLIDSAGPASFETKQILYLDSIARWIYQEHCYQLKIQ